MDQQTHAQKSVEWDYLSIAKLQQWNQWSLGMGKYLNPHLIMDVIIYPYWD